MAASTSYSNRPGRAVRIPALCASLEIAALCSITPSSYGVFTCRRLDRMPQVSVTPTLKNRSRALLANSNGCVSGADGAGGGPSGSARLARPDGNGREEGAVLLRLGQARRAERHLREHRREERLELAGVVDGRDAAFGGRFVLGQDVAVPVLAPGVRLGYEQDLALRLVAGHQHQDGVGLGDAGQIQEVAVLAVLVVDVEREHARGRAPHDGQRLRRQPLHHPRAPRLQVVLQRARRGQRSRPRRA